MSAFVVAHLPPVTRLRCLLGIDHEQDTGLGRADVNKTDRSLRTECEREWKPVSVLESAALG